MTRTARTATALTATRTVNLSKSRYLLSAAIAAAKASAANVWRWFMSRVASLKARRNTLPRRSDTEWCAELPVCATSPQPAQPSKTLVHIEKRVANTTYIATAPDFAVRGAVAPMGRGL